MSSHNAPDIRDDDTTLVAEEPPELSRVEESVKALDIPEVPRGDKKLTSQVIGNARSQTGLGSRYYQNNATEAITSVELFIGPSSVLKINLVQEQISDGQKNKDKHPELRYQAHSSEQSRLSEKVHPSGEAQSSNQDQPLLDQALVMDPFQSSNQTQSQDHVQSLAQAQSPVVDHLPSHKTSAIVRSRSTLSVMAIYYLRDANHVIGGSSY